MKSFIVDLPYDQSNATIVRAVIALSHSLNMKVVAEGVETAEQVAFLMREGCDVMQGYYFSRAIPLAEVKALIANNTKLKFPV